MFDVLVAGAGPAGAVAATVLARAGVRVLVLDRARFPRDKLCGDTLNPGALGLLRRLGLDHVAEGGLPVDGMILTGGSAVTITGRYHGVQGRAITRREFDAGLLEAARAAGASVDEGVLVAGPVVDSSGSRPSVTGLTIKGRDGRLVRVAAPVVIAADGRYSRVARALGLSRSAPRPRRWAVGAYFADVANLTAFGEMHVRSGHYLGVAPLRAGLANACIVSTCTADLRDPSSFLMRALRSDVQLADRFARARMVAPAVSLGPLAVECAAAGMPGLLLAGDAAGFVDPMTGDGLRFAIRGGEQAALAACRALDGSRDTAHMDLLAMRRREFARKWRFNRTVRALVGSPSAVRAATCAAPWFPSILRHVISYAGDCS
jgi:flavin-dependent dehydrogenase